MKETTNVVMTAMLLSDVFYSKPVKYGSATKKGENTLALFSKGGVHGGVWRAGYTLETVGPPSVIVHFLGGPSFFLVVFYAIFAAIAAGLYSLFAV